ncbi:hypothetical protein FS837_011326 [Tulasnella sp. UAMH 9824]|nr:hypothetical protein FS837_011326 [Tulasnella sp. UAMH 9824]
MYDSGSDSQFEFILNPDADPWSLVVRPDSLDFGGGDETEITPANMPPVNCSYREVHRISDLLKGQLFLGHHIATVANVGWSMAQFDLGTGILISSVHSGRSTRVIIGGVVGGTLGLALVVATIVIVYRRRLKNRGEVGNPNADIWAPGYLTTLGPNEEGFTGSPVEKREDVAMAQEATATTALPRSPQEKFLQAAVPRAAHPQEGQALRPLPSLLSTRGTMANNTAALQAPEHSMPQLSPQQVRLVQDLMDQGIPSPHVASVISSMLASSRSNNTNATVTTRPDVVGRAPDAPPKYDFKDT